MSDGEAEVVDAQVVDEQAGQPEEQPQAAAFSSPPGDPEQPPVSTEIVRRDSGGVADRNLFGNATPVEVVTKATEVADALKDVLVRQRMIQNIQGRDHVKIEGWQTTGAMLGLSTRTVWSRMVCDPRTQEPIWREYEVVEYNRRTQVERRFTVQGNDWEAKIEVVRAGDGMVLASGEGMCSRNESTWSKRDDYALRSMALTRAASKALRQVLGWIVTMAGYEAAPSDEMPPEEPLPFGLAASDQLSASVNAALGWATDNLMIDGQSIRQQIVERAGYLPTAAAQSILLVVKSVKDQYEQEMADKAAADDAEADTQAAEGPQEGADDE